MTRTADLYYELGEELQSLALPERITVGEAMSLFASFYPSSPVDWRELLEALDLGETVGRQLRRLSGGQKQRVSVALALVGDPRVAMIESIRDRGVTILLFTHFMEEAERLADRLAVIDAGRGGRRPAGPAHRARHPRRRLPCPHRAPAHLLRRLHVHDHRRRPALPADPAAPDPKRDPPVPAHHPDAPGRAAAGAAADVHRRCCSWAGCGCRGRRCRKFCAP